MWDPLADPQRDPESRLITGWGEVGHRKGRTRSLRTTKRIESSITRTSHPINENPHREFRTTLKSSNPGDSTLGRGSTWVRPDVKGTPQTTLAPGGITTIDGTKPTPGSQDQGGDSGERRGKGRTGKDKTRQSCTGRESGDPREVRQGSGHTESSGPWPRTPDRTRPSTSMTQLAVF